MSANSLRTEQDLRDALQLLSEGAPEVDDVAPAPSPLRAPRRWSSARWTAPIAAAVLVAAVAVGLTRPWDGSDRDDRPLGAHLDTLIGLRWQVQTADGLPASSRLTLFIKPNGKFFQDLGGCSSLTGALRPSPTTLSIEQVQLSLGLCPIVPPVSPHDGAVIASLRRLFTGHISWSINDGQLTLSTAGRATAVYTLAPGAATRTRQWTFHGVGITLPADWPVNAEHCGTPIENTVIFPHPTLDCLVVRPAGVTSVEFRSGDAGGEFASILSRPSPTQIDGVAAVERTGVVGIGSEHHLRVNEVSIPSHNMTVVIASPSNVEPFELQSALYIPSN